MHGDNQFPNEEMRGLVLEWMARMSKLGRALLKGVALGLGLESDTFETTICRDPTEVFRILHYPPPPEDSSGWGVGEHTDYGLITILAQDDCGGLEVKVKEEWVSVPVSTEELVFVVNIGDMLDKLTQGRYLSNPHRVRNASGRHRLSYPFFVEPSWDAEVLALPLDQSPPPVSKRWDDQDIHAWTGTYGEYLTKKYMVSFPDLFKKT